MKEHRLSSRYKEIITILGESNHPLRAAEIINLGIPNRTVYNILNKGQRDGLIRVKNSLYELTDKGKNYFHKIQDSNVRKILQKNNQNLNEIQNFFKSISISELKSRFVLKRLYMRFAQTISEMDSKYLSQLVLLYIAEHHPLIFFNSYRKKYTRKIKNKNLLDFINTHLNAVRADIELRESIFNEFKKRINYFTSQIDSPILIELKAKNLPNSSFFILENDVLVCLVDSIVEDLILEKGDLELVWIIKNSRNLIKDSIQHDFLDFLEKEGLLDELITYRYKFKYSEKLTANKKDFLKTVNETIPLFISEVLCKKFFTKTPFSNNYEELTLEPLNSYIYTSAILCDIKENLEQALQVVEEGLKLFPNFYILLVNKGIILGKLYRFSDAIQTIKKGIKYSWDYFKDNEENYKIELINLLKLKMNLLIMNNDYDGAFRVYKTLLKLDPPIISSFIFIKYDRSNQEFSPHQSTVSKLFNEDVKNRLNQFIRELRI